LNLEPDGIRPGHNNMSFWVGSQEGMSAQTHYDLLLPKAGGWFGVKGDYLFHDSAGLGNYQGLWGLLRINDRAGPPVPDFTYGCSQSRPWSTTWTCSFSGSASSEGAIVSWAWNFGDHTTGSGQSVLHTYSQGTYQVTLTVTDDLGRAGSVTKTVYPGLAVE
jgi:PKD repeat protein